MCRRPDVERLVAARRTSPSDHPGLGGVAQRGSPSFRVHLSGENARCKSLLPPGPTLSRRRPSALRAWCPDRSSTQTTADRLAQPRRSNGSHPDQRPRSRLAVARQTGWARLTHPRLRATGGRRCRAGLRAPPLHAQPRPDLVSVDRFDPFDRRGAARRSAVVLGVRRAIRAPRTGQRSRWRPLRRSRAWRQAGTFHQRVPQRSGDTGPERTSRLRKTPKVLGV